MTRESCLTCQSIQMASDKDLGRMVLLANEAADRETNRRVALEIEHGECRQRIAELEARVVASEGAQAVVNQRLANANDEIERLRKGRVA